MAVSRLRRAAVAVEPMPLEREAGRPDDLAAELEAGLMTDLEALAAALTRPRQQQPQPQQPPRRDDLDDWLDEEAPAAERELRREAAFPPRAEAPPPQFRRAASRTESQPAPRFVRTAEPSIPDLPPDEADEDGPAAGQDAASWANRRWEARLATAPARPRPARVTRPEPKAVQPEGRWATGRVAPEMQPAPRAAAPAPQLTPSAVDPDLAEWWSEARAPEAAPVHRRRGRSRLWLLAAALMVALAGAAAMVAYQAASRGGLLGVLAPKAPTVAAATDRATPAVTTIARSPIADKPTAEPVADPSPIRVISTSPIRGAAPQGETTALATPPETPPTIRNTGSPAEPLRPTAPRPDDAATASRNRGFTPAQPAPVPPPVTTVTAPRPGPTPAEVAAARQPVQPAPPAQTPAQAPPQAAAPAAQPNQQATGLLSFVFGSPKNPNTRVVNQDVNVRSGPRNEAPPFTVLKAGTTIAVSECKAWCKVTVNDREGWVFSGFLSTP